ncbi:MAG TPA: antibiotic biosynthesis monooxygenase [Blastocatellia bacterium]|nr:antibiotic biosynthesis monooxygenase [Blastocatellia bacterium]
MIARAWHGVTEAAKSDEYFDYLEETGIAEYRATRGNRGVFVLLRIEGDKSHFLLLTIWESVEAIKRFAGSYIEQTRYYPEDEKYLLELEPTVTRYEILAQL